MPVCDKLAYALGHRDQGPNKTLAQEIVDSEDLGAMKELETLVLSDAHKRLRMDAALTMAYVGELNPEMLVSFVDFLLARLNDPVDRVGWGSMIALSYTVPLVQKKMYDNLPTILDAMDIGGIVGRDHGYRILITLYGVEKYREDVFFIVLEQIQKSPPNQLGQYTERLMSVITDNDVPELISALEERRDELTNEHHIKRLTKNLKKLYA
ncbi:MAG: hypothetical protein ABJP45_12290 [Cyclobacteriaceae bacterium]